MEFRFLRNVVLKALALFAAVNLALGALGPLPLGKVSGYNWLFPGRPRFPFGETPVRSYNLSLYDLDAMFAAHEIAAGEKPADEFRVIVVGDSSVWGTLLRPEETLAGQLETLGLTACGGKRVKVYNLGYPTLSLTKDLMVLEQARGYQPDLILWPVTLESLVKEKQLISPIVANNSRRVRELAVQYSLTDAELPPPDFWSQTWIGQRRANFDLIRLQLYGAMWAATGIDQDYPEKFEPSPRNFDKDISFHGMQPGAALADELALDALDAGLRAAGDTPVVLVNEPILISAGENSELRYNVLYPRWAYDAYRQILSERVQSAGVDYLDIWDLIPESEFTNSAIHLTAGATRSLAEKISQSKEFGSALESACR